MTQTAHDRVGQLVAEETRLLKQAEALREAKRLKALEAADLGRQLAQTQQALQNVKMLLDGVGLGQQYGKEMMDRQEANK